jgi:hypothetical protein
MNTARTIGALCPLVFLLAPLAQSALITLEHRRNTPMDQYPDHPRIAQKLLDQQGDINRLTTERNGAYRERAHLLAWLAALHGPNAVLAPAPDIDDEDGWHLLFLTVAGRQLSWHIAPHDVELFNHVERVNFTDPRAQWDGHTTDEKYQRIRTMPWGEMRDAVRTPEPAAVALGEEDVTRFLADRPFRSHRQQPSVRCACAHAHTMHTGPQLFCAVPECPCARYAPAALDEPKEH